MSVTVLLPVYNGGATLAGAIESILRQDIDDWELLIIDDGSTDGSALIAESYRKRDTRITVVVHELNQGLAATLNEGLALSRRPLVARLDQDDEALPPRLRVQVQFMQTHSNVAVAGSDVFLMGRTPRFDRLIQLPHSPREVARRLPLENCIYHPSVILRREVVLTAGGYRPEFKNAEDYDLWLRLSRTHDLANVATPLIRYRFSLSGMTIGRKWEQLFYVHLAQEMNVEETRCLVEATETVKARIDEVDRPAFMRHVVRFTARELTSLRLWRDAVTFAWRFAPEIGALATLELGTTQPSAYEHYSRLASERVARNASRRACR